MGPSGIAEDAKVPGTRWSVTPEGLRLRFRLHEVDMGRF